MIYDVFNVLTKSMEDSNLCRPYYSTVSLVSGFKTFKASWKLKKIWYFGNIQFINKNLKIIYTASLIDIDIKS